VTTVTSSPLRVTRVGHGRRQYPAQARDVREHRLEALRVLRAGAPARPCLCTEHDRTAQCPRGHVRQLGCLVEDGVQADADEVHEHDFDDRAQSGHGRPDRRADVTHLADRRVQDTLRPEALVQALRHGEDAAAGADVDADQND
jgi:hypothetical protein